MIAEQLKKAVLQAAIQGKLTEQLPGDGDARDLLAEILAEKDRLIKEGKLKKDKPLPAITDDEIPFDIPDNWCWVRLGSLGDSFSDGVHYAPKYIKFGVPCISAKDIYDDKVNFIACNFISNDDFVRMRQKINVKVGSLLFTKSGSIGRSCVIEDYKDFGLVESVGVINFLKTNSNYIKLIFDFLFNGSNQVIIYTKGIGVKHLTLTLVRTILIPLPPIAEQKRIVDKLDEILPELVKLSQDETKLEDLQKIFSQQLKSSLLQAAIQGKLTDQLPEDGNALKLLEEIKAEKQRLISSGKLKKEKPLLAITEDEIPFDIPETWCWVRLSHVSINLSSKPYQILDKEIKNKGAYPVVSQGQKFIAGFSDKKDKVLKLEGPIIIFGDHTKTLKLIDFNFIVGADGTKLLKPICISTKFLYHSLALNILSIGTRNYGRHFKLLNSKLIPLPPLSEQKRIVDRLEELLPLCDALD